MREVARCFHTHTQIERDRHRPTHAQQHQLQLQHHLCLCALISTQLRGFPLSGIQRESKSANTLVSTWNSLPQVRSPTDSTVPASREYSFDHPTWYGCLSCCQTVFSTESVWRTVVPAALKNRRKHQGDDDEASDHRRSPIVSVVIGGSLFSLGALIMAAIEVARRHNLSITRTSVGSMFSALTDGAIITTSSMSTTPSKLPSIINIREEHCLTVLLMVCQVCVGLLCACLYHTFIVHLLSYRW